MKTLYDKARARPKDKYSITTEYILLLIKSICVGVILSEQQFRFILNCQNQEGKHDPLCSESHASTVETLIKR